MAGSPAVHEKAQADLLALGPSVIRPLLRIARGADLPLAEAIKGLLPRFGPEALPAVCAGAVAVSPQDATMYQSRMWQYSMDVMAAMGEDALPEVLKMFESSNVYHRPCAEDVLNRLPRVAGPALVPYLRHKDQNIAVAAATMLAHLADRRTADAMLAGLESSNPSVRRYCARGLGGLRDKRAVEPLLRLLDDENTRGPAAAALGRMWEPRFTTSLTWLLKWDSEPSVRTTVAEVFSEDARNPVLARVARRYKPYRNSMLEEGLLARYALILIMTGLIVYLLIWSGVRWAGSDAWRGWPQSVWVSWLAVLVFGFVWGFAVTRVSGWIELSLLAVAIPLSLGFSWVVGPRAQALWKIAGWLGIGFVALIVAIVVLITSPLRPLTFLAPVVIPWALALTAPVLVWWVWRERRKNAPEELQRFRRAALRGTASFYAGYAIGYLVLWGYLGF